MKEATTIYVPHVIETEEQALWLAVGTTTVAQEGSVPFVKVSEKRWIAIHYDGYPSFVTGTNSTVVGEAVLVPVIAESFVIAGEG